MVSSLPASILVVLSWRGWRGRVIRSTSSHHGVRLPKHWRHHRPSLPNRHRVIDHSPRRSWRRNILALGRPSLLRRRLLPIGNRCVGWHASISVVKGWHVPPRGLWLIGMNRGLMNFSPSRRDGRLEILACKGIEDIRCEIPNIVVIFRPRMNESFLNASGIWLDILLICFGVSFFLVSHDGRKSIQRVQVFSVSMAF